MDFNEYQKLAIQFDTAKEADDFEKHYGGYMEKVLGLAGETGEVIEKIKKNIRDKDSFFDLSSEDFDELKKELGDVLWYLSAIAFYNGIRLGDVAVNNLSKLEDRKARGKIHGSGDNR